MKNLFLIVSILLFLVGCRPSSSSKSNVVYDDCVANVSNTRMACLKEESNNIYNQLEVVDVKSKNIILLRSFKIERVQWLDDSLLKIYRLPEMIQKEESPIIVINVENGKTVKDSDEIR